MARRRLSTAAGGRAAADYTGGGPAIWDGAPRWLDLTRGDLWGTIAIQDHGPRQMSYEDTARSRGATWQSGRGLRCRWRLSRDLAARRRLVLGQEVGVAAACAPRRIPWPLRTDDGGPPPHPGGPADRRYFAVVVREGVSRAARTGAPMTELGIDLRRTPHLLGVRGSCTGRCCGIRRLIREVAQGGPRPLPPPDDARVFAGYFSARIRERFSSPRYRTSKVVNTAGDPTACSRAVPGVRRLRVQDHEIRRILRVEE